MIFRHNLVVGHSGEVELRTPGIMVVIFLKSQNQCNELLSAVCSKC